MSSLKKEEKALFNCEYCGYNETKDNESINQFWQIGQDDLQYSGLEELFFLKYKNMIKIFCPKCQNIEEENNFKKCYVQYRIKSYHYVLFVLFDLDYNDLINNKNNIISYCKDNLSFEENINYKLMGIICAPMINHFICIIFNFQGLNSKFLMKNGSNYIHDGCNNEGKIIEVSGNIKDILFIHIPYILIFRKCN